jgi:hypothetical protein
VAPSAHLTPSQRSQRARIAAHALHAQVEDPRAHTAKARRAFLDRFEREADPTGALDPAERARRAAHLRRRYMTALALKSSRARAARAKGTDNP